MTTKIENIKAELKAHVLGRTDNLSEVEILANYGDGSTLVGFVQNWKSFSGEYHNDRRVAYFDSADVMKWCQLAQ